jgi:membrane-associated protein
VLPFADHLHSGLFDLSSILSGSGPWLLGVVAALIFIESGLLFPFLPGDTLLFTAALLAPAAGIPLPALITVAALAAIAGDQVGYAIGRKYGRRIFTPHARILKTRYLDRADAFLMRYGPFSIVLARFVPFVRTFVPALVGASHLRYRTFVVWNVLGGVGWTALICSAGVLLGHIPFIAANLDLIAVGIAVVSLIPIALTLLRERRNERAASRRR